MMREFNFLFNRLPFYIIFYPTSRCNARCPHCFNYIRQDNANSKEELSLAEIDKISGNFNHVKVLTISGGEPFLRDDLTEIVEIFYKNNGLQYVSFHTNAFLVDRIISAITKLLNKYNDLQVIICISIDDIGESHDRFRGVEGGFSKALETIERLKKIKSIHRNLHLVTSTIFSKTTMCSFQDTINFIKNNIGGVRPSLGFIRGSVKDEREKAIDCKRYEDFYKNFNPEIDRKINPFSPMAIKEALEMVATKIVLRNYRTCGQAFVCQAGRRLMVIYENGDVYPCEILTEKFGNLREVNFDIKKLLFSEKAKYMIDKIRRGKECYCTWENIIPVNLLFNPLSYSAVIYEWVRLFILKRGLND